MAQSDALASDWGRGKCSDARAEPLALGTDSHSHTFLSLCIPLSFLKSGQTLLKHQAGNPLLGATAGKIIGLQKSFLGSAVLREDIA